jgi:hypothetical protein
MIAIFIFFAISALASLLLICACMFSSHISEAESPLESRTQEKETSFALEMAGDMAS